MSTFSSVLRKPGQKITPKAAPRRNVQRQAQKASAGANFNALTPESVLDSPRIADAPTDNPGAGTSLIQDGRHEERLPTPPATVQPSPSPAPTQEPVQIPNREHSPSVPPVVIEQPATRTGQKRKALEEKDCTTAPHSTSPNAANKDTGVSAAGPGPKASKRKKIAPRGAPSYLLSRSQDACQPETATNTASRRRSSRRDSSQQVQRAESDIQDLLQRSRTGLSAVSELSRSIDRDTDRRLRSRSRRGSTSLPHVQDGDDDDPDFQAENRIGALASAVVDAAAHPRGRKRHRKGQTPDDPETHEIDPDDVQMGDLTKDSGLGKRSETGRRLDTEWIGIKARWDERAEKARQKALERRAKEKEKHKKDKAATLEDGDILRPDGIKMNIVNGQIVVDQDARERSFHEDMHVAGVEEAIEDEPIYRYVNQNRIGKKAGMGGGGHPGKWDQQKTDLFYKGLRMFGTDFEMIANMLFPGKTRKEVKDKFVREERSNHARIIEATRQREEINLEELMKENDLGELKDPDAVMREIEADEENMRKAHEEKRAQENGEVIEVNDEADLPIPSIEVDGVDGEEEAAQVDEEPQPGTTELEAGSSRAAESTRPKQRKPRQPRRATRDASKAKATRKGKKPLEGVEERIGTIDDVERGF